MNLMKTADLNIDLNNNPKSNINYTNKIINKYTNIINIHYPYVESTFFHRFNYSNSHFKVKVGLNLFILSRTFIGYFSEFIVCLLIEPKQA